MTTDIDTVIERRRLRRRLTLWRGLAIAGLVLALFAIGAAGDRLSDQFGSKQIARVAVEGTILESRDQLELLRRIGDADNVKAVLVFVMKKNLPAGGGQAAALAKILDLWAQDYPDPYLGPHWPPT